MKASKLPLPAAPPAVTKKRAQPLRRPTENERYEARLRRGAARSAATRSRNARPRKLAEVRATVRDAAAQLDWYLRREDREDLRPLLTLLGGVLRGLSLGTWSRKEFERHLESTFQDALARHEGHEGHIFGILAHEYRADFVTVAVTERGARELQKRIDEAQARARAEAAAAAAEARRNREEAGTPLATGNVIDLAEAVARGIKAHGRPAPDGGR